MAEADKENPTLESQRNLNANSVPADWLLLGLSNVAGYGAMLQMPKGLAKTIVPTSITYDIEFALLANIRLIESGHEVELRSLIDNFLRKQDIEALESLVLNVRLEEAVDSN